MNQTQITLQTKGILLKTKNLADQQAQKDGFASFQEVVRMFTKLYAQNGFPLNVSWGAAMDPDVQQSIAHYKSGKYKVLPNNKKLSDAIK